MIKVTKAEFIKSATQPSEYPPEEMPEIAFVGRSNVGKSSLINTLTGRKKLAITSSTPGRTRLVNFFGINDAFRFVDLPGYGFARAPKSEKAKWQALADTYLRERPSLCAVVSILDIRHPPSEMDQLMQDYVADVGIGQVIALTKADKLTRNQLAVHVGKMADALGVDIEAVVPFSSLSGVGKQALWKQLERHLPRP